VLIRPHSTAAFAAVSALCLAFAVVIDGQQPPRDGVRKPLSVPIVETLKALEATTENQREVARAYDTESYDLSVSALDGSVRSAPAPPHDETAERPTREPAIQRRVDVCSPDAVVVGTVESNSVFLNARGSRLLSMYDVRVTTWLKPSVGPTMLEVGDMGGRAIVAGRLYQTGAAHDLRRAMPSLFVLQRRPKASVYSITSVETVVEGRATFSGVRGRISVLGDLIQSVVPDCTDLLPDVR
jgi:hypothetical protein